MRLIDANDYRERRCRTCINRVQCDNGGNLCFDIMVLNTCPTIEAQPVKHGRWINDANSIPRCSECSYIPEFNRLIDDYYYSDFCPKCGARMDGGSK